MCWGLNQYGQLGYGYVNASGVAVIPSTPVLTNVSDVSTGQGFTCALQSGALPTVTLNVVAVANDEARRAPCTC